MERHLKVRSLLIGIFFFLLFFVLIGRLYVLQVVEASELRSKADDLWTSEETLQPVRGSITDRNGKPLAEEGVAYTVAVNPLMIHERGIEREAAHGLAKILSTSQDPAANADLEEKIYKMVTKKKPSSDKFAVEVEIRNEGWKIDADIKDQVDQFVDQLKTDLKEKKDLHFKEVGIYTKKTTKRMYPNNRLASQLLGFINRDGVAQAGLERYMDEDLTGTPGMLKRKRDLKGVEIPNSQMTLVPAVNGKSVSLTIDQNIQYYTETALRKAYETYKPKSMTAIAVNPKTMEILAMASLPDYNPNKYWESPQENYINHAISDQFEPGSTFKLVTLAGAIEEKIWTPDALYKSGNIKLPNMPLIQDYQFYGWGENGYISFMEGLIRSSNVAFVKMGYEGLGTNRFTDYIKRFGFGQKTGVDLPGEATGLVDMKWQSDFARATYGQSITVTAMQEVAAYAAIATGGELKKPQIIKSIFDTETGKAIQTFQPETVRRIVSEETARQASLDLEKVVTDEHGTGRKAFINGYRVAGKTGTANIVVNPKEGYADGTWLVSFIGYAPVEDPQILVAVIADQPQIGGDYHKGGDVTMPAFKDIMIPSLAYLGVPSSVSKEKTEITEALATVPDVVGLSLQEAKNKLAAAGLTAQTLGNGEKVTSQLPKVGSDVLMNNSVFIIAGDASTADVPDLTGLSLRDTLEIAALLKAEVRSTGEGFVVGQNLTEENGKRVLKLELAPYNQNPPDVKPLDGEKANQPSKTQDKQNN
ncbi:penicillin-binding transpeptidase domain-containing protein [Gorillibacterium massiliense]|uniref:penicillin-binding transpeptidase domain-containing protein n=1 Tax=Gorillibacterium massiliense TaxID=1280390 RepID=UPI0004BC8941|nr:penicillin-binding transpeptidase domain-containing protein [Gorillibacterium massiliense]